MNIAAIATMRISSITPITMPSINLELLVPLSGSVGLSPSSPEKVWENERIIYILLVTLIVFDVTRKEKMAYMKIF